MPASIFLLWVLIALAAQLSTAQKVKDKESPQNRTIIARRTITYFAGPKIAESLQE
jgi:hypothetical protein